MCKFAKKSTSAYIYNFLLLVNHECRSKYFLNTCIFCKEQHIHDNALERKSHIKYVCIMFVCLFDLKIIAIMTKRENFFLFIFILALKFEDEAAVIRSFASSFHQPKPSYFFIFTSYIKDIKRVMFMLKRGENLSQMINFLLELLKVCHYHTLF